MRAVVVGVVVLWGVVSAGLAIADDTAMKERHERLIAKATRDAFAKAKTMPELTNKAFAATWRRTFDRWVKATCKCPYRPTKITGESNSCVVGALDDFTVDLMLPMFRLHGFADSLQHDVDDESAWTELAATGQSVVEDALDAVVPAKEQLRRQAQMKRCFEQAGVL